MRIEHAGDVALVRMEAGKANAIGPAFLSSLSALLDGLAGASAAVITGQGSAFSAGLDLPSLVELDRPAMRGFMQRFDEVTLRIFELPVPLVAAINGHAIAGGCVLALQCDVRLIADGPTKIGLNEARLGIGLPPSAIEALRFQLPPSSLVPVAIEGTLFAPMEAKQLGLVDDVVPSAEVLARGLERARALARGTAEAASQVKLALRRPALRRMEERSAAEAEQWLDSWFSPAGQQRLAEATSRISRPRT
jgi:enoyl-CoA hydratase